MDVIHLSGELDRDTGHNRLLLSYGARFRVAGTTRDSEDFVHEAVRADSLDLDLFDDGHLGETSGSDGLSEAAIRAMNQRLREIVVPFLDTLADYGIARAALERGVGYPEGTHRHSNPSNATQWEVVGRLALAHHDKPTAEHYLQRAVDFARGQLDVADTFRQWRATEVARLTDLLDRARALP